MGRRRIGFQLVQERLNRTLQLRIVSLSPCGRIHFDLDVRRHTVIFNLPFAIQPIDGRIRSGDKSSVHQLRKGEGGH